MDIDLLGRGDPAPLRMAGIFRGVLCSTDTDDGVEFDVDRLDARDIRGGQEYGGVRVTCPALIGTARVRLQIDVGFGDVVTPAPVTSKMPGLLDFPCGKLSTYPPETVIAEKLEAIVRLGRTNSRMKDYYDLLQLSRRSDASFASVLEAIQATFERRGTPQPVGAPVGLTPAFANEPNKRSQWAAFCQRLRPSDQGMSLIEVISEVHSFLAPAFESSKLG